MSTEKSPFESVCTDEELLATVTVDPESVPSCNSRNVIHLLASAVLLTPWIVPVTVVVDIFI
jgi:hypothetical protein